MNLGAIFLQLEDALAQVPGVRPYVGLQEDVLTSSATATAVVIRPGEPYIADYHAAMSGGLARINVVLEIVLPRTSMRAAQLRLAELLSSGDGESRSIIDTLRAYDRPNDLNGEACDFVFRSVSGINDRTVGAGDYLGVDMDLEVLVRRTLT